MVKLLEPELAPILNGSVSSEEAIEASRQHLEQDNPNPRWCIPWAYVLWQQGDYSGAYALAARYHTLLQDDGDFLLLFGMIARQVSKRRDEAEAAFQAAIRLQPDRHDAYYNLGNLYFAEERFEEAAREYRRSLDRYPDGSLSWLNLGLAARALDQLELSRSALQRCLQLDPRSIRAWCNYGITCHQLERFDQAIEAYYQALSLDQDHGPSLVNLAQSLNASNRHPEAVGYLQAASSLTLQEDCGDALFNLALTRLLLGEYELGWELYECRFKTRQHDSYTRVPKGEWIQSPERLRQLAADQAEILVWSEQGLGDAIQFGRYLHLLQAMGLRPVLATRPVLVRLFQEWLQPSVPVIDDNHVDITTEMRPHTAMLSLPHLFGTTRHTVPASMPCLHPPGPPPETLLVPPPPGGLAIGLVWASNPDNKMMYRRKSLPLPELLESLLPALREDLLELHCLQVGEDADALQPYADHPNIVDWNGRLGDFADTAHVVRQLDLVISVDTGVAHLAGSLGVQTWLMLHYDADFRWMRNCETSPWYPGMRLFRQKAYGDWSTIVQPLMDELGRIYGLDLLALQ
ncbi:tetratricopeptide repeat protein [Synechococcus sp. A15-60]|uniref:tetratricopeptide repeat protein n=1 Tax=Synechococcus sp. A15-60 TaxID=1050655 RepID=UPI0016479AD0|nr:tetratricopeptide repeat protein [Synechococcus sp. A15-60]QNI46832.1 TPR repeat-containing protein [Synechococcus sp. A15-60]